MRKQPDAKSRALSPPLAAYNVEIEPFPRARRALSANTFAKPNQKIRSRAKNRGAVAVDKSRLGFRKLLQPFAVDPGVRHARSFVLARLGWVLGVAIPAADRGILCG